MGFGCTTCIGNSGPLPEAIGSAIKDNSLVAVSVLSGNRNFEGRIHPLVRANYLASPPLVVAYALAGRMDFDMEKDSLGNDRDGKPVYLRDIWPTPKEVEETVRKAVTTEMYRKEYGKIFDGDERWRGLKVPEGDLYAWDAKSTYIKRPPFFDEMPKTPPELTDIRNARVLAVLGSSVTTDHISPAGSIQPDGPAGKYLIANGVKPVGLQLLRRAPRQSRSDDARHVREYSPAQSAGPRHRRRLDGASAERREDDHLRRGRCATSRKACRSWCSRARNTARDRRGIGRRRARCCSACAP